MLILNNYSSLSSNTWPQCCSSFIRKILSLSCAGQAEANRASKSINLNVEFLVHSKLIYNIIDMGWQPGSFNLIKNISTTKNLFVLFENNSA